MHCCRSTALVLSRRFKRCATLHIPSRSRCLRTLNNTNLAAATSPCSVLINKRRLKTLWTLSRRISDRLFHYLSEVERQYAYETRPVDQAFLVVTLRYPQVIFAHLISKVLAPIQLPTAVKTLVLAHREELIEQAAQKCALINPTLV